MPIAPERGEFLLPVGPASSSPVLTSGYGPPTQDLAVSSVYIRRDGGVGTIVYVKESAGAGGWTAYGAGGGALADVSYQEFTSDVTISGANEGAATPIIAADAFTPNGTDAYWIEFYAARFDIAATAGATVIGILRDNGAAVTGPIIFQGVNPVAAACNYPLGTVKRRLVPTAISHTYSIAAYRTAANGFIRAGGGVFMPGYIRVSRAA